MKRWMAVVLMVGLFSTVSRAEAKGRKNKAPVKAVDAPEQAASAPMNSESPRLDSMEQAEQPRKPRIEKVDDATIRFLDEHGRVKKEMRLRRNSYKGRPPAKYGKNWGPDAEVDVTDEERDYPSPDGQHVGIIKEDAIGYEEGYEGTRQFNLLDAAGNVVWKKSAVLTNEPPRFSQDGRYLYVKLMKPLFEEDSTELSKEELERFGDSGYLTIVYDVKAGREVLSFPCDFLVLSTNGYYGVVSDIHHQKTTLFSIRSGKTHVEEGFHRVEPSDEGIFKFYVHSEKPYYGPDGELRKIYTGKEIRLE